MTFILEKPKSFSDEIGNSANFDEAPWFKKTKICYRGRNCQLTVGANVDLMETDINLVGDSKLIIGNNVLLRGSIWVGGRSTVVIGDSTRVTSNIWMSAVAGKSISIGKDCLLATGVKMRTHDGHPIYDTKTGQQINENDSISLGDHVWLADDVLVLKGASIGCGAIVGARSIVSGFLPSKTLSAGVPCRVLRNDVTWEHNERCHSSKYYDF